ncbi:hypothetical protein [Aquiflexum lacus]|uniref:hypothetical protein n=1 Tax=Aquiflexum lacus TaxID=2483805 RepID=UPI001E52489B|nr:hypothetical protein [Aquiflexum lacus]
MVKAKPIIPMNLGGVKRTASSSTFMIPKGIIALETGVVENDSVLFEWDEEKWAFLKLLGFINQFEGKVGEG